MAPNEPDQKVKSKVKTPAALGKGHYSTGAVKAAQAMGGHK